VLRTATPSLKKLRNGVAICALALVVSACGGTKWGFPYRADVQQGNWITAEQVARLEKGMTREQVRFILGTPVLQDIFRTDRWDYTYYNKPGYGKAEERKLTVWFNGDLLDRWENDALPDRQPFQKQDSGKLSQGEPLTDHTAPDSAPQTAPEAASGATEPAAATPPNEAQPQPLR